MKVKFCSHGIVSLQHRTQIYGIAVLNPAWLFMEKWYDLYGQNPDLVWLEPGLLLLDSVETVVENIVAEAPDLLGLGLYVWNADTQFTIAKQVKKALPNTVIVLGGPDLAVHKMDQQQQIDFFSRHPYVDYVVYGDGEKPFTQIIDYHGGFVKDKTEFINIIENAPGNPVLYPWELLADKLYLGTSPYLDKEHKIAAARDYLANRGITNDKQSWTLEFARGCPYSCTFCDWSQNLTKKVKRRTHSWKDDINLFCRLDLPIREADANFGQWTDDLAAFDYACSLYDPGRNFEFIVTNTSKLKKDASEYIIAKTALTYDKYYPTISIQDPHEDVLSAIDRPTVPWQKQLEMILNLKRKLPHEKYRKITIETILGLPEQTLEKIIDTYVLFFEIGITRFTWYTWFMLQNSPAAEPSYQKMWGLQVKDVYMPIWPDNDMTLDVPDFDKLCQNLDNGNYSAKEFNRSQLIVGHRKMSMEQIWAAKILHNHWQKLNQSQNTVEKYSSAQIRKMLEKLRDISLRQAQQQYLLQKPTIEKYNVIVWGHYDIVRKQLCHGI